MDMKLGPANLRKLREALDKEGWNNATLDLFDREIFLAEYVPGECAKMQVRLTEAGLSAAQLEAMTKHLARLVLEPLLLVDRAHRELWSDFLPDENMATHYVQPHLKGGAVPCTFASVALTPWDVLGVRPDLTEWQAKVFLERYRQQITGAMTAAAWEILANLLKGYQHSRTK